MVQEMAVQDAVETAVVVLEKTLIKINLTISSRIYTFSPQKLNKKTKIRPTKMSLICYNV